MLDANLELVRKGLVLYTFRTVEEAQDKICPRHKEFVPDAAEQRVYDRLYELYSKIYFEFGQRTSSFGRVLPNLIEVLTAQTRTSTDKNIAMKGRAS